jgi:DNA polymerase delta subunit 1
MTDIDQARLERDVVYRENVNMIRSKAHGALHRPLLSINAETFLNPNELLMKTQACFKKLTMNDSSWLAEANEMDAGAMTQYSDRTPVTPKLQGYVVDQFEETVFGKSGVTLVLKLQNGETAVVWVEMSDYFYIRIMNQREEDDVMHILRGPSNDVDEEEDKDPLPAKNYTKRFTIQKLTNLQSVYGYSESNHVFLQVKTWTTRETKRLSAELFKARPTIQLFESSLDYIAKFNAKTSISGCSFIEVDRPRSGIPGTRYYTRNVYTADISRLHVITEAPFFSARMFYYDIECLSINPDVFPTSETCPIIQISYVCNEKRGVLCVGHTPGYESYETESQMLVRFAQLIVTEDPDVLCGYNSNGFDMPYIIDRMKLLKLDEALKFSRDCGRAVEYTKERRESAQTGARWFYKFRLPGRIMMDICEMLRAGASTKLTSYSLKNVCSVYLNDNNKDDIRYRDIPELMKTADGRSRIAKYCLQDSVLVYELDHKLMLSLNAWTLTRALGTTPRDTLNRGLVFKLMTKLKQYTSKFNFVIPSLSPAQRPAFEKYPGALVLEPVIGLYLDPVVVLDFESLYPSEIRSANLSYDTMVTDKVWMDANPDKWVMQIGVDLNGQPMKSGHAFVKRSVRLGILPRMEEELGLERAAAKKKMKAAEPGSRERFVYDGLQQAAKIVMNSLYGMLGSSTATIPMVEVASTITALGRKHLMMSKNFVEQNYHPAKVIYGDTDSIFILMPGVDKDTAISNGRILEKAIREQLYKDLHPMNMQYEKVFSPFLITRKKGYSGKVLKNGETEWKISTTGFANVKRDTARLGTDALNTFLDSIFEGDVQGAKLKIQGLLRDLFAASLDLSYFKITKKIAKHPDTYKSVPPHINAWRAMKNRIGDEAPSVGEMFDFVVVHQAQGGVQYVDIVIFKERYTIHDIDLDYYYDRAIYTPLLEPLSAVYGKAEAQQILDKSQYTSSRKRSFTKCAEAGNLLSRWGVPVIHTATIVHDINKKTQGNTETLRNMFEIKKRKL